jgi:hypothetical protein
MPTDVVLRVSAAVGVAALYALVVRRRVPRGLLGVAQRRHLVLREDDPFDLPSRYGQLYLLGLGHARRANWILCGPQPAGHVSAFQYAHKLGLAQRWARGVWTVAVVETADVRPGSFVSSVMPLVPAGMFARYRPVRASGSGAASSAGIWGESPATLERWLGEGLAAFLAGQDPGTTWELRGRLVAGYLPGPIDAGGADGLIDAVLRMGELTAGGRRGVGPEPGA